MQKKTKNAATIPHLVLQFRVDPAKKRRGVNLTDFLCVEHMLFLRMSVREFE